MKNPKNYPDNITDQIIFLQKNFQGIIDFLEWFNKEAVNGIIDYPEHFILLFELTKKIQKAANSKENSVLFSSYILSEMGGNKYLYTPGKGVLQKQNWIKLDIDKIFFDVLVEKYPAINLSMIKKSIRKGDEVEGVTSTIFPVLKYYSKPTDTPKEKWKNRMIKSNYYKHKNA